VTIREFEVARLIADGRTNAAIAEELTISPKTASSNVEHILGKLGFTRRAEIEAWVTTISRPAGTAAAASGGPAQPTVGVR
jgi:DNA-binding CsgD family transcriptional regulator